MKKIMHIITRLDMGGSAQNTLLTCRELAGSYDDWQRVYAFEKK